MIFGYFKALFFFMLSASFGGSGGQTSSSNQTTTNNKSQQLGVSDQASAITENAGTITINSTDGGVLKTAVDLFKLANDARAADYGTLLKTSGEAISGFNATANKTISDKQNSGSVDNKTIMILGTAALAVMGLFFFKRA